MCVISGMSGMGGMGETSSTMMAMGSGVVDRPWFLRPEPRATINISYERSGGFVHFVVLEVSLSPEP